MRNQELVPVPIDKARVGDVVEIGGVRCRVEHDYSEFCNGCYAEKSLFWCVTPFCNQTCTADGISHIYRPIQ